MQNLINEEIKREEKEMVHECFYINEKKKIMKYFDFK